jgi:small subunit ribosomal protein S20
MANHKSAKKRQRQDSRKRLHNRFYKKTARTAIAALRGMEDQKKAEEFLPRVVSMIDRLAKKNQIHENKANNLKGKLAKYVHRLGQ